MTETFIIGAGLLTLGIAIGAILMNLFGRMAGLERRIKGLEDCKQKRLPYNTAAGLEDALAVGLDLVRHQAEVQLDVDAWRQRTEQLNDILRGVRGGPGGYDPDKPAGPRPR